MPGMRTSTKAQSGLIEATSLDELATARSLV
jgi:hypothetical protein